MPPPHAINNRIFFFFFYYIVICCDLVWPDKKPKHLTQSVESVTKLFAIFNLPISKRTLASTEILYPGDHPPTQGGGRGVPQPPTTASPENGNDRHNLQNSILVWCSRSPILPFPSQPPKNFACKIKTIHNLPNKSFPFFFACLY